MPINPKAKLVSNTLDLASLEQKPARDGLWVGFGARGGRVPECGG